MTASPEVSIFLLSVLGKGAAALLITAGTAWLLREWSATYRHAAWALGLGIALILPLAEAGLPQWALYETFPTVSVAAGPVSTGGQQTASGTSASASNTGLMSSAGQKAPAKRQPALKRQKATGGKGNRPSETSPNPVATSDQFDTSAGGVVPSSTSGAGMPFFGFEWKTVLSLLVWAWVLGAALIALWVGIGISRAFWWTWRADPADEIEWSEALTWARNRVGGQNARLYLSPDVSVPMTMGLIRPAVLLPVAAKDWPEEQRHSVLLHELAHVSRGDWATNLLARLSCAVHWPNPLAWHAAKRLRRERERACDQRVLAAGVGPTDYADHLVAVAREAAGAALPEGALAMARSSELKGRVESILSSVQPSTRLSWSRGLLLGALTCVLTFPLLAISPLPADFGERDRSSASQPAQSSSSEQALFLGMPGLAVGDFRSLPTGVPASGEEDGSERNHGQSAAEQRPVKQNGTEQSPMDQDPVDQSSTEQSPVGQEPVVQTSTEQSQVRQSPSRQTVPVDTSDDGEKEKQRRELQERAIYAISELSSETAVPKLLEIARAHSRAELRARALQQLADHGSPELISALTEIAQTDTAEAVQTAAVRTLGHIYGQADQSNGNSKEYAQTLRTLALEIEDQDVGAYAIRSIGELKAKVAIPVLIDVAESDVPMKLRSAAIQALGAFDDPRAAEALMRIVGTN